MSGFAFPIHQKDVTKTVKPKHLVPWAPRASWDGWFAICIFPPDSGMRWLKAHLYRCICKPGRRPLAAVEGFGDRSEMLITWGTEEGVEVHSFEVDAGGIVASSSPLRVELWDHFLLEGDAPNYIMSFKLPDGKTEARFTFETGWPIWWSRWGRILNYVGQHAAVRSTLIREGKDEMQAGIEESRLEGEREGFGVMEHVCGVSLPFDFTRVLPVHYHWDVLAFHTSGSPFDSAAGLSIGRKGKNRVELRAAAQLPGCLPEAMKGLRPRYIEVNRETSKDGQERMIPVRWEGVLSSRSGRFRYEAHASTPVAAIIPGGGMLGFDFEGEWRPSNRGRKASGDTKATTWRGTGFSEYGDFSGLLVELASGT